MDFGLGIVNDRQVVLRFLEFPDFAHDRLYGALTKIEARLEAAVLADEPDRTGALRRLTGGRVYDDKDKMAARVAVRTEDADEAKKAAALEYGSRGIAVSIKAHEARLEHFWSRHVTERMVEIEAHTRVPTITAKRFLRGPIEVIRDEALAEMRAAVDGATEDAA